MYLEKNETIEVFVPTMLTIKELSEKTKLSKYFVRRLVLENKVQYVKSGNKYLVNYEKFLNYLNTGKVHDE